MRKTYIDQLKHKDQTNFRTAQNARGSIEAIFLQLDLKPLVFGSFTEMSSNVKNFVDTVVEYAVDHLRISMATTTPEVVRTTIRRRFKAKLYMAAWRGYTNLILDRTKYGGTGVLGTNIA